jgi:hypothetical protein
LRRVNQIMVLMILVGLHQFEIIIDLTPNTMQTYNLRLRQQLGEGKDKGDPDIVQGVNMNYG